jgi:CheY-like chemotaxis protein
MALSGPILLIEDDENDIEVIRAAITEIGVENEVISFLLAQEALDYLYQTTDQPFLILCDVRMPGINGLALRKIICKDEYLKRKSIPFIFFSVAATPEIVNEAYELDVQGFYLKERSYKAIKDQLLAIFIYWQRCLHPNRPGMKA